MQYSHKRDILFGCIVGAICMLLFDSYIIENDSFSQCSQLSENVDQKYGHNVSSDSTTAKPQIILPRENCTTEVYNTANAIEINNKISNNGTWPYSSPNEICAGNNSSKCLPAFIEFEDKPMIYTAETSKTALCLNLKSASQLSGSLSCMLNDPLKFFYEEQDLIKNALKRSCDKTNLHRSVKELHESGATLENGWKLAMIVREPLERFVSGFIFTCMNICGHRCNDCGPNIDCYLDRQVKKFEKMIETKNPVDIWTQHLFPQNWACDLRNSLANYTFVKFNSDSAKFFDEGLGPFFRSQNVSDQALAYIRNRLTSTRTEHSNTLTDLATYLQNKIRSSPQLLEKFLRIFYHDYTTFNFPFPELIK